MGIRRGYRGLINGECTSLDARSVGGILGKGGTFLGTTRLPEFADLRLKRQALRVLNQFDVDGLVVIGGNGSLTGALALHKLGFPTIGVPGTIDNDLYGTDYTIGFDTAVNTAIEAGADTVMDLSTGGKIVEIREAILDRASTTEIRRIARRQGGRLASTRWGERQAGIYWIGSTHGPSSSVCSVPIRP